MKNKTILTSDFNLFSCAADQFDIIILLKSGAFQSDTQMLKLWLRSWYEISSIYSKQKSIKQYFYLRTTSATKESFIITKKPCKCKKITYFWENCKAGIVFPFFVTLSLYFIPVPSCIHRPFSGNCSSNINDIEFRFGKSRYGNQLHSKTFPFNDSPTWTTREIKNKYFYLESLEKTTTQTVRQYTIHCCLFCSFLLHSNKKLEKLLLNT